MSESGGRTAIVLLGSLALFGFVLLLRPEYLASPEVLGTVIIAQVVIAAVCRYRQSFFAVLMIAFLWAGMDVPLHGVWLQGRWMVLAIGSLAGLAIYMKDRSYRCSSIHLVAFFCVLSAVVSASVSSYPQEALLKSLSIFLLFLYCATGARLAIDKLRPYDFFRKLLVVCEAITYVAIITYFVFRWQMFGNPNSLGAVAGVVLVPILFWGFLCAESTLARRRLALELCLALTLLLSSFSRAGIAAAAVSCVLVAFALRHYRMIVTGVVVYVAIAVLVATVLPRPTENLEGAQNESITGLFLYKGKPEGGLLGSRKGPWDQTIAVIKQNPWFGSGFGTSVTGQSATYFELTRSRFVDSRMVREHGNSYLAILEWSGLLGVFPFYFLIGISTVQSMKALSELRRSQNLLSPAVPAAAIIIAGVIGSGFEDWLFAVGYHLSVFFWAVAFILADSVHSNSEVCYSEERHTITVPSPQFVSAVVP